MLSLTSVTKRFGGLEVLRDVSLEVPAGSISALIGPNGAGKTTAFNLMTGLIQPTGGSISFEGTDLVGRQPHRIAALGIARTFQNLRTFKEMTLVENVVAAMHRRLDYGPLDALLALPRYRDAELRSMDRARELLDQTKLGHRADMLADNLSYGDQRRLEIARALATEPKLLLLDEPVAGMNAREKVELMHEIRAIRDRGVTVLVIEHDMRFVMGLCERISVLNFGRVIAEGRPEDIRRNEQVIEAYLGRDDAEMEPATEVA